MKTFLAVFFAILAAAAVIAGIFGVLVWRQEKMKTEASHRAALQLTAVGSLRTISTACITYRATYDRYPEKLVDMAPPPAAGNLPDRSYAGLIDDVLASGGKDGYLYSYAPTLRDRKGRVTEFAVMATRKKGKFVGIYNFFVDQTGVIRATLDDRPATASDPPYP